jgi:tetratricopeptide (TPR) repeat protein
VAFVIATRRQITVSLFLTFGGVLCWAQAQDPATAAYQRGSLLHRTGDCVAAIPELKRAGAAPRVEMMLASCYLDTADFASAGTALDARLKADPEDIEALSLLATVYERTSRTNDAIQKVSAFLATHDKDLAMRVRLARLYLAANNVSAAEEELKKADALQPGNPVVVAAQAAAELQQKHWKNAIDLFHRAEERVPDNLEIEMGLSTAYLEQEQCPAALPPLNQAQKLAPLDYGIAKKMARCYRGLEQWAEVVRSFRTNTRDEASDPEGTAWMLDALRRGNRAAESEEYLQWAVKNAPKNEVARVALADLLFEAKRYEEAAVHYTEATKAQPAVARFSYRLGLIAETQKKPVEARTFYAAASGAPDAQPEMHSDLARVCLDAKDLACARQALDRIPTAAITTKEKGMRLDLEYQSQRWPEVWKEATELLAQTSASQTSGSSGTMDIVMKAAEAAKQLKRPADRADMLERAVKLAPADQELRLDLVSIYENDLNRPEQAAIVLNDLITNYKGRGEAYLRLANIYLAQGRIEDAKFNYRKGLDELTVPIRPDLYWGYMNYGQALVQAGQNDDALANMRKGVDVDPKNAQAVSLYAQLCVVMRKTEELAAARQKLVDIATDEARVLTTELDERMRTAGIVLAAAIQAPPQ